MCQHCQSGKAIRIIHILSVFVALGIQHAKHMCCILLSPVARTSKQYLSTRSHKQHNFQKYQKKENVIEHEMCLDFVYKFCLETFLILRNERDLIKIVVFR
jgi:hypothetical protein